MDDLISRAAAYVAAIEAADKWDGVYNVERAHMIEDAIKALPSVQPERKTGKWLEHEFGFWTWINEKGERDGWTPDYECSLCGSRAWKQTMKFCPNCGAKMEGLENEKA